MKRLETIDRLLLVTLLPLATACLALHIVAVTETGLARLPFVARAGEGAAAFPILDSWVIEQRGETGGLEIGDHLLRMGERDLRGVGHLGAFATAIEQADPALRVPVRYERRGTQGEVLLALSVARVPWARIPAALCTAVVGLLVLLRAPPASLTRLLFGVFMGFVIWQTPFHGREPVLSYLSQALFYLGGLVVPPLLITWGLLFPPEAPRPRRFLLVLPWAFGLVYLFLRSHYFFGGLVPGEAVPVLILFADLASGLALLGALYFGYRRSGAIGRRRSRWVLFGFYVGCLPLAVAVAVQLFVADPQWFNWSLPACFVISAAAPVGVLVGAAFHNLFDIDRLFSATATWSALSIALLAAGLSIIPAVTRQLAAATPLDAASLQVGLSLALAGILVPMSRRVRARIERRFFPERHALQTGIAALLEELSGCSGPVDLFARLGQGLDSILRPDCCLIYRRADHTHEAIFARGREAPPSIPAPSPVIATLQSRINPLVARRWSERSGSTGLTGFDQAALDALEVAVILPIHRNGLLAAFVGLGPKRSGDVYTATDLALLTAIGTRAGAELVRWGGKRDAREASSLKAELAFAGETRAPRFEDVILSARGAIVIVEVPGGIGSGFLASSDGLVLTCDHVLGSVHTIFVRLADGRRLRAKVEQRCPAKDLALLRVGTHGTPSLRLGRSRSLVLGEPVIAIGSPGSVLGTLDQTVTKGIVSGLRTFPSLVDSRTIVRFVQTDAALNRGNSGGPLLNRRAEVVGIVTLKDPDPEREGLSFAIALEEALEEFPDLGRA